MLGPPHHPNPSHGPKPGGTDEWREKFSRLPHSETKHFSCRQDCRSISDEEVNQAVKKGELVESNPDNLHNGKVSPKYVVRGRTSAGRELEVVFALPITEEKVVLITTYATEGSDPCDTKCQF